MYRRYRRRRYYKSYNEPSLIEAVVMLLGMALMFVGKLLFRLMGKLFQGRDAQSFKLNIPTPPSERPPLQTEPIPLPTPVSPSAEDRYGLRESLLTGAEKEFLNALTQVVGDRYHVELQVQLSRIVSPKDSTKTFTNYRDFNRIKAKSIDFVLYDSNYKPYLCIELDDRTHLRWDRIKRDIFVDEVMKGVGLPIIHVRRASSYDLEELKQRVFQRTLGT
jgi:hypothetical protein